MNNFNTPLDKTRNSLEIAQVYKRLQYPEIPHFEQLLSDYFQSTDLLNPDLEHRLVIEGLYSLSGAQDENSRNIPSTLWGRLLGRMKDIQLSYLAHSDEIESILFQSIQNDTVFAQDTSLAHHRALKRKLGMTFEGIANEPVETLLPNDKPNLFNAEVCVFVLAAHYNELESFVMYQEDVLIGLERISDFLLCNDFGTIEDRHFQLWAAHNRMETFNMRAMHKQSDADHISFGDFYTNFLVNEAFDGLVNKNNLIVYPEKITENQFVQKIRI